MNDEAKDENQASPVKQVAVAAGKIGLIAVIGFILLFLYILGVMIWYLRNP